MSALLTRLIVWNAVGELTELFSLSVEALFNVFVHFFDSCYDGAIGIFLRPTTTAGKERILWRSSFMRCRVAYCLKRLA